jgi:hypothetical protein
MFSNNVHDTAHGGFTVTDKKTNISNLATYDWQYHGTQHGAVSSTLSDSTADGSSYRGTFENTQDGASAGHYTTYSASGGHGQVTYSGTGYTQLRMDTNVTSETWDIYAPVGEVYITSTSFAIGFRDGTLEGHINETSGVSLLITASATRHVTFVPSPG